MILCTKYDLRAMTLGLEKQLGEDRRVPSCYHYRVEKPAEFAFISVRYRTSRERDIRKLAEKILPHFEHNKKRVFGGLSWDGLSLW